MQAYNAMAGPVGYRVRSNSLQLRRSLAHELWPAIAESYAG
jgi:hypothetical protein